MQQRIVPIADSEKEGIPLPKNTMRWSAFWREDNGAPIFKVGGRLYVDVEKFTDWMRTEPRISPAGVRGRRKGFA